MKFNISISYLVQAYLCSPQKKVEHWLSSARAISTKLGYSRHFCITLEIWLLQFIKSMVLGVLLKEIR